MAKVNSGNINSITVDLSTAAGASASKYCDPSGTIRGHPAPSYADPSRGSRTTGGYVNNDLDGCGERSADRGNAGTEGATSLDVLLLPLSMPVDFAEVPEFPALDNGITLLESDTRVTGAMQSLVLDHVLVENSEALWVDARGNAATTKLTRIAPSRRILAQIRVARAFTPYQHYSLIDDLSDELSAETSLLVLPAVEWFYASDEHNLRQSEGEEMLRAALTRVKALATGADLPVVITRQEAGGIGSVVLDYVEQHLRCELTEFGPRFEGDEFETLLFRCNDYIQTTLAFWQRVLEHRHSTVTDPSEAIYGTN